MPRVAEHGMSAVAMTDHGNMFGAIDFYRTAASHGIKPIIGCEMYVAPQSRFDKQPAGAHDLEHGGNFHLILLAMNQEGYRNLCRLVTAGFTEGFYRKPRVDRELLRELNGGLIALSGCLSGELARAMLRDDGKRARAAADEYASIFDERFYVEVQANHLPEQEKVNPALIELARQKSLPLIATNDCHYLQEEDAEAHEVLLCGPERQGHVRREPLAVRHRPALRQNPPGNGRRICPLSRRHRQHRRRGRPLQPRPVLWPLLFPALRRAVGRNPGRHAWPGRPAPAWKTASPRCAPPQTGTPPPNRPIRTAWPMNSVSSAIWASPATS